jgi:hypothetical protein
MKNQNFTIKIIEDEEYDRFDLLHFEDKISSEEILGDEVHKHIFKL